MTAFPKPVDAIASGIKSFAKKPLLIFGVAAARGHTLPLIRIADELIQRGFEVIFFAGEKFMDDLEKIGAEGIVIPPFVTPELLRARGAFPVGYPRLAWDLEELVISKIPGHWAQVKAELENVRARDVTREVILVTEPFFVGFLPLVHGCPLPVGWLSRPKVININPVPYTGESIDVCCLGSGALPDSTDTGRQRTKIIHDLLMEGYFARCIAKLEAALRAEGATEFKRAIPYQTLGYSFDMTIHLCSQSLEFAYTDLQPRTKFVGLLQPKALPADFQYPVWWKEVTNGDKKIIMVSQGTVAMNYRDLIMPTITALADRDDLLVIALLGTPGATLPKDFTIPANTRVIDYLNYDALLPYVSVFVMNAGYGGYLHGAVHGVPMVLSGESEDKKDVAARGEYAGIAVNLRTGQPTPNQVRAGVERVLGDDSFKKRVMAIMMENRELDVLSAVEKELMALAGADM